MQRKSPRRRAGRGRLGLLCSFRLVSSLCPLRVRARPRAAPRAVQVRAALLSVERSANSRFDLEELFDLLDTKGEGTLKADVVEDLINELGDAAAKVDPKKIYEDAAEVRATTNEITFEQFIA